MSQTSDSITLLSPALVNRLISLIELNQMQDCKPSFLSQNDLEKFQNIRDTFLKLEEQFKALVNQIVETIENDNFQIRFLEKALEVIDVGSEMIKSILKYIGKESNFVQLGCNSLPKSAFNLVMLSYKHCKLSQDLYKEHFNDAAHLLGDLFRKTFTLQKILGLLVSKFCIFSLKSKKIWKSNDLDYVIVSLFDICCLVNEMDKSLIAASWKMLVSFLIQLKNMLHEQIDTSKFKQILQKNIENHFQEIGNLTKKSNEFCLPNSPLKNKFLIFFKMVNFFLELLTSLIESYGICDSKTDCDGMSKFLLPSFTALSFIIISNENGLSLEVTKQIKLEHTFNQLDKIISSVLTLKNFDLQVFEDVINSPDQTESHFSVLLILTRIVPIIVKPHVNQPVNIKYMDVLNLYFKAIPYFFIELNLNKKIQIDQAKTKLYNIFVSNLCALVIAIPEKLFYELEVVLIENLLSVQNYKSTLAADVWCFLARFSTGEVCLHHVKILIKLINKVNNNTAVMSLILRLLEFLEPEQQTIISNLYLFSEDCNLDCWAHFGNKLISYSAQPIVAFRELCERCTCVLNSWIEGGCEISSLILVKTHIKILGTIFSDCNVKLIVMCQSHISSLSFVLIRLWKSLPFESDNIFDSLLSLYTELLYLNTQYLTTTINSEDLTGMMQILLEVSLFKTKQLLSFIKNTKVEATQTSKFFLTVVDFLLSLKSQTLTTDMQVNVTFLWQSIIQESKENWYLRFLCLDNLEMFLATTKYPQLMSEICSRTETSDLVKSHLRRQTETLPNNVTRVNVLKHMQDLFAHKKDDCNLVKNSDFKMSKLSKASEIVKTLENKVRELKDISPKELTEFEISSIKNSSTHLKEYLKF